MTEKSNLEDDLFDSEPTRSPDEESFLKDVLGPYAAEAPLPSSDRPNQEAYDERKHAAPTKVYVTEGGKEVHVDKKESGKYFVKFVPGGELPASLQGEFTREDLAHQAVKVYLANK